MQNTTPFQAHGILAHNPHALLVDVREPAEILEISVRGALIIPLAQLPDRLGEIIGYSEIFFLCRSGARSGRAAEFAESAGVPNVYNITGGIMAWQIVGLPIAE